MKEGDTVIINGEEWPVISVYTRQQAIEDGVLIDVTEIAKQNGFRIPVALTAELFGIVENVPEHRRSKETPKDRLVELLHTAYVAIKLYEGQKSDRILFTALLVQPGKLDPWVQVKLHVGPGDTAEPVCTMMCPWES